MTILMTHQTVLIIGLGNMGSALAEGLMQLDSCPQLVLCEHNADRHQQLSTQFPAATLITQCEQCHTPPDFVILAVKPKDMKSTCQKLADELTANTLVLSIAAGVPSAAILSWLGEQHTVIRFMPNTPASIGVGMSGLYTSTATSPQHKTLAQHVMQATGKVLWLESEEKIDALTALSGSGPAYVFHLMSCLQKAGESMGFSPEETRLMIQQTVLGAALLAQNDVPFLQLQQNVTSKGGTTESALNVFHQRDLEGTVHKALDAAYRRAAEISNTFKDE